MNKFIKIFSLTLVLFSIGIMALSSTKTYSVSANKCIGCNLCVTVCPNNAIEMVNGKAVIDIDKCNNCGECVKVCPTHAISLFDKKDITSAKESIKEKSSLEKDTAKNSVSENQKSVLQTKVLQTSVSQSSKKEVMKKSEPKTQKSILKKVKEISKKIYSVNPKKCIACKICVQKCPVNAIEMVNGKAVIDVDKCIECGICENVCPTKAISHSQKIIEKTEPNSDKKAQIKKPIPIIKKEKSSLEKDTAKNSVSKNQKSVLQTKVSQTSKKEVMKKSEPKPQNSILKKVKEISKKIYSVNPKKCIACKICVQKCPVNAIEMVNGKAVIDVDKCIECGICENVCPTKAISHSQKIIEKTEPNSAKKAQIKKPIPIIKKEKSSLEKDTAKNSVSENQTKNIPKKTSLSKTIKKKINYLIYKFKCVGCEDCVEACPVNAIEMVNGKAVIDQTKCISCGKCVDACTYNAIEGK